VLSPLLERRGGSLAGVISARDGGGAVGSRQGACPAREGGLLLRRAEDARANEKVACIFASHEQRCLAEKKALRRQVHGVVTAARAREAKREEEAEALRREAEEQRCAADEAQAREASRREEAEERLRAAEREAEELREGAEKDAAELRRHKADLASAQRQLEADLARAAETAEAEVRATLEEAARLRRDAEHKDKILSAMLRKSKIDMEDREMLMREVETCKARRKQAELEAERWRKACESSRGSTRGSSRSSARTVAADHPGCSDKLAANDTTNVLFVNHVEGDRRKAPAAKEVDRYPSHVHGKPGT
jgi:flagellar biosynthesis GTPase FlhF